MWSAKALVKMTLMSLALKDWTKYAQDAPIWKELIRCMLNTTTQTPNSTKLGKRG